MKENPYVKAEQLMEVTLQKTFDCKWIDSAGIIRHSECIQNVVSIEERKLNEPNLL